MRRILQAITDKVATKKGMWITLASWITVIILLTIFAPGASDYKVTTIDTMPADAKSVIAQEKVHEYFPQNDGIPAILVFQSKDNHKIELSQLAEIAERLENKKIHGVMSITPIGMIPPQATASFFSEDQATAILPLAFDDKLENKEMNASKQEMLHLIEDQSNFDVYMTGPAGIATDTVELFTRADLVLILSTVVLILILLVIIYRSPLLALIPLLAAGFVYGVVMKVLGILGSLGLIIGSQTLSIMSILLFAAVIDYCLFVFSRYREELKSHDHKYEAMKLAMRETGLPVFFSGATVLAAMLVLFFAEFGDYRNFAPTFAAAIGIIMIASVTLVPALFTLFGRVSFWPKIPRVGDETVNHHSIWSKIARFVVKRPGVAVGVVSLFLAISASNLFSLKYEFDLIKSFPEDMTSRQGYEILEDEFDKGDLAPTTVLFESSTKINEDQQEALRQELADHALVKQVRINGKTEDEQVTSYNLTFKQSPYALETIDSLEQLIDKSEAMIAKVQLDGVLYFSGETAEQVDDRAYNNRDIILIVLLETILIFSLLIVLTKSLKMPIYMMGTILISFFSALGLGLLLTNLFFDIDAISNRVPLYSFVFLVALGIDYNIMLISRFQEERRTHSVKVAVEHAVAKTGGVISSAGIILAATFAVLMTQPVQLLFVFGFIVAVGILIDTFIIRGILLPGLIIFFEKDRDEVKELNQD